MIWTLDATQFQQLQPAITVIDNFLASDQQTDHRLVFHVFSNAGSHAAVQLEEAFAKSHPSSKIPISGLILDSCPGGPPAVLSANAMIMALPKAFFAKVLGAMVIYLVFGVVGILDFLNLYQNVITKTGGALNDPSKAFLQPSTSGVYLFSKADQMVQWQDIVAHAEEARQRLVSRDIVRTIEFTGSGHIGHLAVASDKYADVVSSFF